MVCRLVNAELKGLDVTMCVVLVKHIEVGHLAIAESWFFEDTKERFRHVKVRVRTKLIGEAPEVRDEEKDKQEKVCERVVWKELTCW